MREVREGGREGGKEGGREGGRKARGYMYILGGGRERE